MRLSFPNVTLTAAELLRFMIPVLQELFLIRAAVIALKLRLKALDAMGYITVETDTIHFNTDSYIANYLSKNNALRHRTAINEKIEQMRPKLATDERNHINGHDFLAVIGAAVKKFYPRAVDDKRTRERVLFSGLACCLSIETLTTSKLFISLLSRLKST